MAEQGKYPWKDNDLRQIKRYITDHDDEGKSVFSVTLPEELQGKNVGGAPALFSLGYCTTHSPVSLAKNEDIETYSKYLKNPPGIVIPGGTVARYLDMPPGTTSPMHRTISLDYGVVLEGEMELVLDSGDVRLLKRGDLAVQRGTLHSWRNTSKTDWSRMLYFLQECVPLEIERNKLREDYGEMVGVPKSGN